MNEIKTESFEWVEKKPVIPSGIKGGYLKIIAKTKNSTYHENETRVFLPEELAANSRSLVGRSLSFNHGAEIPNTIITDSEYNPKEEQIECIAFVPEIIINKVKKQEIKQSSIEFVWRSIIHNLKESIFQGLSIVGLSLLDIPAGDPNAIITLFEDDSNKGRLAAVVEIKDLKPTLGEPFAGYSDFDACVAANQDKENPEAYCGAIKAQTESYLVGNFKETKQESTEPKKEEPKKDPTSEYVVKINELEEQVKNAKIVIKEFQDKEAQKSKDIDKAKEEAKKEGKEEVIEKIEKVIPSELVQRQGYNAFNRLVIEVKKVIKEEKQ